MFDPEKWPEKRNKNRVLAREHNWSKQFLYRDAHVRAYQKALLKQQIIELALVKMKLWVK